MEYLQIFEGDEYYQKILSRAMQIPVEEMEFYKQDEDTLWLSFKLDELTVVITREEWSYSSVDGYGDPYSQNWYICKMEIYQGEKMIAEMKPTRSPTDLGKLTLRVFEIIEANCEKKKTEQKKALDKALE